MSNITSIQDYKEQQEEHRKKKEREEAEKRVKGLQRTTPGSDTVDISNAWERNKSLGYSPERDVMEAKGVLELLIKDLDVSRLSAESVNNQRQVLKKIQEALTDDKYFYALGILMREDIKLTNRVLWMILRLNRVFQGGRQGTTDMMPVEDERDIIGNNLEREKIIDAIPGSHEDRLQMEMVVREVAVGNIGSAKVSIESLKKVHSAVGEIVKNLVKSFYANGLPPHDLSGMQSPGVSDMNPYKSADNGNLQTYLRLYEALTAELLEKEKQTQLKNESLSGKKAEVTTSLMRLSSLSEIALSSSELDEFKNKISLMDLNSLKYFDFKILNLFNQLTHNPPLVEAQEAKTEILSWFTKEFSKEELSLELQGQKKSDALKDEISLQSVRAGLAKAA